jgi:ubiquinone/menaquinone biosynthesis C-methylase UbiE
VTCQPRIDPSQSDAPQPDPRREVIGVGGRDFEGARSPLERVLNVIRHPRRILSWLRRRGGYKQGWNHLGSDRRSARAMVDSSRDEQEFARRGRAVAELLADALGLDGSQRVVEIGCGPARIGREIAPRCREWIGLDISGEMLRLARGRVGHLSNVSFHELEGARLDTLADASVDRLYCHSVLAHIDKEDMYRYLREVRRVLVPGGLAYLDTWNLLHEAGWAWFEKSAAQAPLTGRKESWRPQFATAPEFRELIRRAGLTEILLVDESHLLQAFVTVEAGPEGIERERRRLLPLLPGLIGID